MNWYWLIYAFTLLGKFQALFIVITVILSIVLIITSIFRLPKEMGDSQYSVPYINHVKRWWKISLVLVSIFLVITLIIPTKKDIALIIVAGSIGEFVENDENVKKLPHDLFLLLRKEILDEVSDLPDDLKDNIEEKLGVSLDSEKDKLKEISKEELIEMYLNEKDKSQE